MSTECGKISMTSVDEAVDDYRAAGSAKVGGSVLCPACSRVFTKRTYQQRFCCNRGPQNCKDKFWNYVNPRGLQAGAYRPQTELDGYYDTVHPFSDEAF